VAPGEFLDPGLRIHFQDTDLLLRLAAAGTPPVRVEASTIRHGLSLTLDSGDDELAEWVRASKQSDAQLFESKHPGVLARAGFVATR
jgi:GT2 family glycosyltransferase